MTVQKLTGVIPPICTPLLADGKVDTARLRFLASHLIHSGIDGLFANGSMGGFPFLTDAEQTRAIATVVEETDGRLPVMGGLAELGTARAVARAKEVAATGATHLSVLAPLFYLTDQDQLLRYFSQIASTVDLPIVLYDNPVLTKNPLRPETVLELRRRVPNLVGIKESNQDCINLQHLLALVGGDDNFSVLTGSEHLITVGLQMGVDGAVGGLHNLHPAAAVKLYRSFRAGDVATAESQQRILVELAGIFAIGGIWGSFEEAMRYLGLAERIAGDPYFAPVTRAQSDTIRAMLSAHVAPVRSSLPQPEV